MKSSNSQKPLYIIDHYCAERMCNLLTQLCTVLTEAMERRRFDPADNLDFGLEELDLAAAISNFQWEEHDEIF